MNTIYKLAVAAVCAIVSIAAIADDAGKEERFLKATGGIVEKPMPTDAPVIVISDSRKASDAFAGEYARKMEKTLMLPVRTGKAKEGDFVLTITDGGDFAVMPGKRMAVVPFGAKAEETETKLNKALLSLFAGELTPSRLEGFQLIMGVAKNAGMQSPRKVPYKLAVKEGWAPAPTNDIQKAIWEKAKAEKEAKAEAAKAEEKPAEAPAK